MAQRRGPDGSARVAISGTYFGEPWANVFWALLGGGSTANQTDFSNWVSNFGEAYHSNFSAGFSNQVNITLASGTLFQPNSSALHATHAMSHVGVQTTAVINDLSACRVASWLSNVYWRGGKPRTYLPGVLQSETTDNKTLTTAAATGVASVANGFHTAVNALSAGTITQTQHGFVSFMSGGVDRVPSLFFPITGGAAHHRLGTQRRRLGPWVP